MIAHQPIDAVAMFAPWCDDAERALRSRIYRSRDICGAHAARTEGWKHHIWKTAEELAGDIIWRRTGEAELRAIADAVVRLIEAARILEEGRVNA